MVGHVLTQHSLNHQHLPYCFTLDSRYDTPRRNYGLHVIDTTIETRKIAGVAM
jgi:hypothetical protein